MSKYFCDCCNYDAKVKGNYVKHLKTMKHHKMSQSHPKVTPKSPSSHPKVTPEEEISPPAPFSCKYCGTGFKYKQGMYRHIKYTCKQNEDEDLRELARLLNEQLREKNEQIEKMQSRMQKQIEKLTNKLKIQNINNGTINNINNNTINIQLLNHKDTDYSHLTDKDYMMCIKNCNRCVKTLIEKVHFNKDKPENMNIYISSIKGNYIMVYKDNEWQIANRKEQLDNLFDSNETVLEIWHDEYKEKYPHIINSFKKYLNNKEGNDLIDRVKQDILLMLYNKRHIVQELEE